jgi:hypothetical protein
VVWKADHGRNWKKSKIKTTAWWPDQEENSNAAVRDDGFSRYASSSLRLRSRTSPRAARAYGWDLEAEGCDPRKTSGNWRDKNLDRSNSTASSPSTADHIINRRIRKFRITDIRCCHSGVTVWPVKANFDGGLIIQLTGFPDWWTATSTVVNLGKCVLRFLRFGRVNLLGLTQS